MSRIFKTKRRVRVGDCDVKANLRIDAIARYLQDVGYDDTNDLGLGDGGIWVARSIEIIATSKRHWPKRNQIVDLETYCGGIGRVVAQRNVNIFNDGIKCIETKTLWVSLDEDANISRVPTWLKEEYSDAVDISSKRVLKSKPEKTDFDEIVNLDFPLRQSDLDINNHANNSLGFDALFEASRFLGLEDFSRVYIEYHRPIDIADDTTLKLLKTPSGFDSWLITAKHVACSMKWEI